MNQIFAASLFVEAAVVGIICIIFLILFVVAGIKQILVMTVEINIMTHPLNVLSNEKPWYSEGLRFKCTECGQCCTGAPGYAWVTDEEIKAIADYLKITVKDFGKRYLRFAKGRYALVEKKNYDCIFLKDKKCHNLSCQTHTMPHIPLVDAKFSPQKHGKRRRYIVKEFPMKLLSFL